MLPYLNPRVTSRQIIKDYKGPRTVVVFVIENIPLRRYMTSDSVVQSHSPVQNLGFQNPPSEFFY